MTYRGKLNYSGFTFLFSFFCLTLFISDIDECATNTHTCDANAICTNIPIASFTCRCKPGYRGSGQNGNCTGRYQCLKMKKSS